MATSPGSTTISVKADGREAAENIAVMLTTYLHRRLSLNDAIVVAEQFVRRAITHDEGGAFDPDLPPEHVFNGPAMRRKLAPVVIPGEHKS
jgi:hypothetical protein